MIDIRRSSLRSHAGHTAGWRERRKSHIVLRVLHHLLLLLQKKLTVDLLLRELLLQHLLLRRLLLNELLLKQLLFQHLLADQLLLHHLLLHKLLLLKLLLKLPLLLLRLFRIDIRKIRIVLHRHVVGMVHLRIEPELRILRLCLCRMITERLAVRRTDAAEG